MEQERKRKRHNEQSKSRDKKQVKRRKQLQAVIDAFTISNSITGAANLLGLRRSTVQSRFDAAVQEHIQPSPAALKEAGFKPPKNIPLSEDEQKFKADWTAEDCCAELRRIAELNPDRAISRNHFRVFSSISESTWNRFFGTFLEFKRQANITLSRHAHKHERHIAKHAAADKARDFTIDKRSYGDKYSKPKDSRWQSILIASDIHDKECDLFYRRVLLDTATRMQPEIICLAGDIWDAAEFSRFTQDPREFDVVSRIRWVHTFLKDLRTACPDAQIDLLEGNHEFRLLRHLSEATPALKAVLGDLHGFTVPRLLGLDEYEVNYIAPCDLAAFSERDIKQELSRSYKVYFQMLLCHHFPNAGRKFGIPGVSGHHHKHIVWPGFSPHHGAYEYHQIGCGHKRKAIYTDGEMWANGFIAAHCDTKNKRVTFDYTEISEHAISGGKWFLRQSDELV